jgi:hypothetical protein
MFGDSTPSLVFFHYPHWILLPDPVQASSLAKSLTTSFAEATDLASRSTLEIGDFEDLS